MNIYTNKQVAEYIQDSIQIKVTVPMLFEFLDYNDEISLIIEEPQLIKTFIFELQQIKELDQLFKEKQGKIQPQQKSKTQIIVDMIQLILKKNMINDLNSVYVEFHKLKYFFQKFGNKEGIALLNSLAQVCISWNQMKDNLINTALITQSKILDYLILESIEFDEVQLTANLSKRFKKLLKSKQVKMMHYYYYLEQSNQSIIQFLLTNLSDSDLKQDLMCETRFSSLCKTLKKDQKFQAAKKIFKLNIPIQINKLDQDVDQAVINNNTLNKLKLIYLNQICQQMLVFPQILKQLKIDYGILKVRDSYQLFESFQKDPRLIIINTQLKIENLLDHFTCEDKLDEYLQNIVQQYDLQYLNQEILLYTIISHLKENQSSVHLELTTILQDTEFQQFYSQLSQVHEGSTSKLIAQCISDMVNIPSVPNTIVESVSEGQQNLQIPKKVLQEYSSIDNNQIIQNIKQTELVQRILQYCLLNKIAIPEIFKYFDYSSKLLTIKSSQQFELEMEEFTFVNLNEFPLDKQSLLEQLVKMIELIQFNQGQIEQQRFQGFLQIIPKLINYFDFLIQNRNENNFQDKYQDIGENKLDEEKNSQLGKQAIRLLQEMQQCSQNLPWQIIKKNYLIQILNHAAYINRPLPHILEALDLVESELTLKVDKSLTKFLKISGLYQYPNYYSNHLQENDLICKLLEILSQEIINPDIQNILEEQLQSFHVKNLYSSLKQLKLNKYLQYFNKLYGYQAKYSKADRIRIVYILKQNLSTRNDQIKRSEEVLKIELNLSNQFIKDLTKNPQLSHLNNQCQLSQLLSNKVILQNYKNLNDFFKQQITQIQPQLEEKLIFDAITNLHQHQKSIVKDLHLVFQYGAFVKLMVKLQNYFHQKIPSESQSYSRQIYEVLVEMQEYVNRNFDSKLLDNQDFHQNLIEQNAEDKIVINKKSKISQNRNIRKMLQCMIERKVAFPEFINFLHIIDTTNTQRLQINKGIEFINFIENNRKIQIFINTCINGEDAPYQKVKLTDFERLPSIKVTYSCMDEVYEQITIINILQILFNQKEIYMDSLKYIFQQSAVQSLIYDMKQIYTQRPHKKQKLLQAYQIMYDLNYWTQQIQKEEYQNYELNNQQTSESQFQFQQQQQDYGLN